MTRKKPNIVFYFSDQQRWDTLGCYGQKLPVSPYLDQLAAEGVLFKQAYTPQPVCGPARAMLQTGRYPTEIGCFRNNLSLPLDVKTLANHLDEAGYDLGYIGKWHLASHGDLEREPALNYRYRAIPMERRGGYKGYWRVSDALEFTSHGYDGYLFDEDMNKVEFKGYRTDAITDFALSYLDRQDKDNPFFMFLSHIEPHHQNDHNHYEGPIGSKEKFKDFEVPEDLKGLEGDYMEEFPDYLGCCNRLDANLGRVVAKLKEKGLYENTVIIYTSDHGSHFRTRNHDVDAECYDDYKRSCHDSCTHIPLIMSGPGLDKGLVVDDLVSLVSLPKTILSLAGVDVGSAMQGEDLRQYWEKEDYHGTNEVFMQISESRVGRALRTPKWKYEVKAPGAQGGKTMDSPVYEEEFLYDLEADPYEKNNRVSDETLTETRKSLSEKLLAHMAAAHEPDATIVPKPV